MSAITNVTLSDGTTPITFTHRSHTADSLQMVDGSASSSDTAATLELSRFRGKRGSPVRKLRLKLSMFYLETVSGGLEGYVAPPKVAFVNTGTVDYSFNKRSTTAQCSYLKMMLFSAQQHGSVAITPAVQDMLSGAIVYDQYPY